MALGTAVVLLAAALHSLPLFVTGFVTLFVFSGLGNGSTYKMIPAIPPRPSCRSDPDTGRAGQRPLRRSGAIRN